jgi:hypothetical protein
MADKNIQMTQRNSTNDGWDNLYPKTKAANVTMTDGSTAQDAIAAQKADNLYQPAGGTATVITLTIKGVLTNGYPIAFIATANNNGAATTINGKHLYKPNTTISPTLIAGKAYTVWYNSSSDCFFVKASAEGDASVGDVLAGKKFSNDNDTGLVGTLALSGTAAAGDVANGKTFYNTDAKTLITGINTNKKSASGTIAASDGGIDYVNGLAFTPSLVVAYVTGGTTQDNGIYIISAASDIQCTTSGDKYNCATLWTDYTHKAQPMVNSGNQKIVANGFQLFTMNPNLSIKWYAFE